MGAKVDTIDDIDKVAVSIHAPVMGAKEVVKQVAAFLTFQSTHP